MKTKSCDSLAKFWDWYCKGLTHLTIKDKGQHQNSDWSIRPLTESQLEYAAHDTYFLLHIAYSQILSYGPDRTDELLEWYQSWNEKVNETTYRSKDSDGAADNSCLKVFNKLMDFYDPGKKDYLLAYYVFKTLYELRDITAQDVDVHVKMICSDQVLLSLSRVRPIDKDQLGEFLDQFLKEQGN